MAVAHRRGQEILGTRRLVEAGVDVLTTSLSGPLCGRVGNWDDHAVNAHVFNGLRYRCWAYDQAVTALIEDIHARGLAKRVMVVVTGEFGRTPRMNGHAGRDHWSDCFSVLLAGGGLQGGRVIGASEKWGGGVRDRLVTPLDLLATIYHTLGVPLDTHYEDASGRPVSIVGGGQVIHELL